MAEHIIGAGVGWGRRRRDKAASDAEEGNTPKPTGTARSTTGHGRRARGRLTREGRAAERWAGAALAGGTERAEAPIDRRQVRTAIAGRWLILSAAFLASVAFAAALARVTLVPVPEAVGQVHSNLRPGD
ncbi:hypothetical protein [Kitasatospora sp. NPDC059327]|uniref:hypothetical protein n=1 Tax=Kitasatospora sp. NPDC059327 TaxID=3346803 RepID=UPI0036C0CAE1